MSSTMRDAFANANVIVTCGPGGIGKTTSAAALAAAIATTSNRSVLVLTVDPARRLADALGVPGIGNEPVVVETPGAGELSVAMLDPRASWDALIRRQAADDATAERILQNVLYQNITRRFVQSHDYIAMERLHELVGLNRYDLIVVDTPPTRNALDFLDAPSRMADFFSSRFLKWLIAPTRGGVVTLAAKPLTYIADRILGGAFLADITEFFLLLNSMYDGFVERAREVEALLANPGTSFLVVSTIESVPLQEATFFNEQLLQRGLHVAGWLVNRLLPSALRDPASPAALDTLRVTDLQAEADRLDVSMADVARIRDAVLAVAERGFQAATAEAARLAELAQGVTPVFAAATAEDEIDTFAGITTFGQRLLDAPRVVKFAE